ncbi:hypothetical protein Pla163_26110 [Planctomycetes bacterium Pla163]|uniref:Uncharacterized protein n=1 Tax=Rohdeia mirabilis TaxID=2528008 RepID=A0A518D1X3_9BACT|nr:hypothetical protein Pla163_26110 [Planctomycetes bacterium Pla163]
MSPIDLAPRSVPVLRRPFARRSKLAALTVLALASVGCSGSDDSPLFQIRTSRYTALPNGPMGQQGNWVVFTVDEAAANFGSLNDDPDLPPTAADNDTADEIAVAVRLNDGVEFATGVTPREFVAIGNDIYFSVDEAAGADWNGDMTFERVLVRFNPGEPAANFVTVLSDHGGPDLARAGGRTWFVQDSTPMNDETNLAYVDNGAPNTPTIVMAESMEGPLVVTLLGQQDDLLLCALDETDNADQNGDADTDDDFVLCLVDADADVPVLVKTGLALPSLDVPFAVERTATDGWRVAFFVSETDQAGASLNEAANFAATPMWNPAQCTGGDDTDATDDVLHVLDFEAGAITMGSVVNTGISGVAVPAENRVFLDGDIAACLSDEAGFGACDYDGVGGATDTMLRWVDVTDLNTAGLTTAQMLPVETSLPGGGRGAVLVGGRLVVASTTTITVATIPVTEPFLFWVDPTAGTPAWSDDFYDPDAGGTSAPISAAVDWMGDRARQSRVGIGLLEQSVQINLNRGCLDVDKDGVVGDGNFDLVDAVASWIFFNPSSGRMIAAGVGWAVEGGNSGLIVAGNQAMFRVSEAEDGFDWNADGSIDDMVLFRTFVGSCSPTNMGTLNDLPGTEAAMTSGTAGAFYLVDEDAIGVSGLDINDNGTVGGYAVRHFRF